MMLSKEMVWIFSVPTLEAMRKDLEDHKEEVKTDPKEPDYLARMIDLIKIIDTVINEKT